VKTKKILQLLHYQKYLGLFLIVIGIPIMFIPAAPKADMPLMFGLFTLFVATEKVEDERSVNIKTSSLTIAFIFSYTIKIVSAVLYEHSFIPYQLVEINHFIILVFSFAVIIYYTRMYSKDQLNEEHN
jgi:hypothetical protein